MQMMPYNELYCEDIQDIFLLQPVSLAALFLCFFYASSLIKVQG